MNATRALRRTLDLVRRQSTDWKLMVARRTSHGVAYGLTQQYESLYATFLGADPVQLGSLHTVGIAVGALASVAAGWFIDFTGIRRVFLLAAGLLVSASLIYLVAPDWIWLYAAMMLYYVGERITCTSCTVTCAAELPNEERATGRGICRSLASVATLATPLAAAAIVAAFGGIRANSIRPLYGLQMLVLAGIFVLLLVKLRGRHTGQAAPEQRRLLSSFGDVFRQGPDVVRMMFFVGLMQLPWTISLPFMPVFAHQFKGADEFILSGIYMASAVVPMVLGIPLGRLADRYGRKKLLFAVAPLAYVANLALVFAPASGWSAGAFLLGYGVLFGFNHISMSIGSSMAAEVMPRENLGRWIGAISLFKGLLSIPAPLIGGLIWEGLGPQYVFLAVIAVDIAVRLPLLASIRETLRPTSE